MNASIISVPSLTKNKEHKRDPAMKSTKKGNQWYFGMKVHVGTDKQGRVHSMAVTDASVHDSQVMDDLVHGEEDEIYGDKVYVAEEHKQQLESQGVTWRVSRKAKRGQEAQWCG